MSAPVLTAPRLLGGIDESAAADLRRHAARHGPLPAATGLVDALREAGLTGRGGAAFPTWRKLAAVNDAAAQSHREPVVVGNAAEGEPASRKDRTLLRYAPHLVLDGLGLAAQAVGARRGYLYLPARYLDGIRGVLAQRQASGWDALPVELVAAAPGFVSGEESAALAAIAGRPPVPANRVRPVVESGLRGAPSLVQNVETLAHAALIARLGSDWFRATGTVEEPGTFLATVGGAVAAGGVYEAPQGIALADLLGLAGAPVAPVRAVLVGGYHGAWVPGDRLDTPVSRAGLGPFGGAPGAGVVVVLPEGACGLRATAEIVSYLAGESAGQCGPCRHGLPAVAQAFTVLAQRPGDRVDPARIDALAGLATGRGACRHPDGTARLVRSALRTFADEVRRHGAGGCCQPEKG
jgi:NADH:ubiquinone oxidoreductase subunit F (NADH-binding)